MSHAVAERNNHRAVAASRPKLMADTLKEESEQRQILGEYVKREMVSGTDYGAIPGTEKPTLLKPGAEKLCSLFRCTPRFEMEKEAEDWDRPFFYYRFRCYVESNDTGAVVAEGFGSANSMEGKWRWRNDQRKCPECGKPSIIKGKAEYGGGWLCFKKKDGCGAKFSDADPAITGQTVGKVENDDVATLVNTILKIAKKRALVDASIALARCSDLFTQDVEDLADAAHSDDRPARHPEAAPDPKPAAGMLRKELAGTLKQIAEAEGKPVADVFAEFQSAVGLKDGEKLADDRLVAACESARKRLARVLAAKQAEAEAGTATAVPPKADPHPTLDREPGVDPEDDEDETEDEPPPPAAPSGARLPKPVVDRLEAFARDAGLTWGQVVARSQRDNAVAGRSLAAGTTPSMLSLDDAGRLEKWLVDEKRRKAEEKKRQEAAVA